MEKYRNIPIFDHCKFLSKIAVNQATTCWEWRDSLVNGYGRFRIGAEKYLAHRVSFQLFNSNLDRAKMLDHICRNRKCVNPDHLRMVDIKTNNLENSINPIAELPKRTHCKNGHLFNGIKRYGYRFCQVCSDIRTIRSNNKRKNGN